MHYEDAFKHFFPEGRYPIGDDAESLRSDFLVRATADAYLVRAMAFFLDAPEQHRAACMEIVEGQRILAGRYPSAAVALHNSSRDSARSALEVLPNLRGETQQVFRRAHALARSLTEPWLVADVDTAGRFDSDGEQIAVPRVVSLDAPSALAEFHGWIETEAFRLRPPSANQLPTVLPSDFVLLYRRFGDNPLTRVWAATMAPFERQLGQAIWARSGNAMPADVPDTLEAVGAMVRSLGVREIAAAIERPDFNMGPAGEDTEGDARRAAIRSDWNRKFGSAPAVLTETDALNEDARAIALTNIDAYSSTLLQTCVDRSAALNQSHHVDSGFVLA